MTALLLLLPLIETSAARAGDWQEGVRSYALKMITEAYRRNPNHPQLQALGFGLQEATLAETHAKYYAYTTMENQKVYLNPILKEMKPELAAETLVHEAGHLIGLHECEADELSGFVVRNSKSSHGLRVSTNLVFCPKVMESTCGDPVLFDRFFETQNLNLLPANQLKRLAQDLEVTQKNAAFQFFLVQRITDWVGGDACTQIYPDDFNQKLEIGYADFFQKKGFGPVIDYLNSARAPYLDQVRSALRNSKGRDHE